MAARWLDDLDACGQQVFAQVLDAANAIMEIVLVQHFDEALGHRFQVPARQAAVGDETLRQDQQVVGPRCQGVVAQQQHAADIDQAVLLGADRGAVGEIEHVPGDVPGRALLLAWLAHA